MAAEDLRVALGLLDARVICGDPKAAEPVIEGARDRWVKQKPPWLGLLADLVEERHRSYGDVGFLLEPDLKESHGGLRDIAALTAMMQAVPVLADFVDTVAIEDARSILVATRVELHRRAGREQNKLLLQEQDQVALALDLPDSDALMRAVATAGRTVAWEGDDAWRRRSAWSRSKASARTRRRIDPDGARRAAPTLPGGSPETRTSGSPGTRWSCSPSADVTGDPSLSLRLAAVAAERNLPIARDALNLLGRKGSPASGALARRAAGHAGAGPGHRTAGHRRPRSARPAETARALPARMGPGAQQAPAQSVPPVHRRPPPARGHRQCRHPGPPGHPGRPPAARRAPARHRQRVPRRPHRGGHGGGRRHRAPDRTPARGRGRTW